MAIPAPTAELSAAHSIKPKCQYSPLLMYPVLAQIDSHLSLESVCGADWAGNYHNRSILSYSLSLFCLCFLVFSPHPGSYRAALPSRHLPRLRRLSTAPQPLSATRHRPTTRDVTSTASVDSTAPLLIRKISSRPCVMTPNERTLAFFTQGWPTLRSR